MAITITSTPQTYTPSDNDIIWEFTSTNTGQANFSFFVKVYIGLTLVGSHIVFPERSNKGKFNASETARLYCQRPTLPTAFSTNASNIAQVKIEIFERYGDPPSVVGASQVNSSTYYAIKSRLTDEQWVDYDDADYIFGAGKKILTDFPRDQRFLCGLNESCFFVYINNGTSSPELLVSLYDEAGNLVASDAVALSSGSLRTITFNAGAQAIIDASILTQGNFDNSSYYTIIPSDGVSVNMETFRIDIDRSCDQYGTRRLHWLNKRGGMDSWSFTKANTKRRQVKSFGFEKQFGAWDNSNNWSYELQQGREQQIIKTSDGSMTLSTDWLTESLQNWLTDELYESPFVLMEYDGLFRRVNVLNTQYNVKQTITDQLFQEVVEINLSDARKSALI